MFIIMNVTNVGWDQEKEFLVLLDRERRGFCTIRFFFLFYAYWER
jgi:hypothetical protein